MSVVAKGKAKRIPKGQPKPIAAGKAKRKSRQASWMSVGLDVSSTAIAGAAFAYDKTLRKELGPVAVVWRFTGMDWLERIKKAAYVYEMIHELQAMLKVVIEPENVHIAIEEPWPLSAPGRMQSNALKQQAQFSGVVWGSLLRYSFPLVYEIQANDWRQIVAAELGITIHHSKWNPGGKNDNTGKLRPREYVEKVYPKVLHWEDLISRKEGLIPRPEDSKAKAIQCDDRYQAICQAEWMRLELIEQRKI